MGEYPGSHDTSRLEQHAPWVKHLALHLTMLDQHHAATAAMSENAMHSPVRMGVRYAEYT